MRYHCDQLFFFSPFFCTVMLIISGLRELHARLCVTASPQLNLLLTFTSIDTEEGQASTFVAVFKTWGTCVRWFTILLFSCFQLFFVLGYVQSVGGGCSSALGVRVSYHICSAFWRVCCFFKVLLMPCLLQPLWKHLQQAARTNRCFCASWHLGPGDFVWERLLCEC